MVIFHPLHHMRMMPDNDICTAINQFPISIAPFGDRNIDHLYTGVDLYDQQIYLRLIIGNICTYPGVVYPSISHLLLAFQRAITVFAIGHKTITYTVYCFYQQAIGLRLIAYANGAVLSQCRQRVVQTLLTILIDAIICHGEQAKTKCLEQMYRVVPLVQHRTGFRDRVSFSTQRSLQVATADRLFVEYPSKRRG